MQRACNVMRANVLEELFVVTHIGKVGTLQDARRMAVWERRWWFDRTEKELKRQNGDADDPQPKGMGMQPTFPQPGGARR